MAEIGMIRDVWLAKIQLCWWHLREAVRTRLKNAKLSTTPYNPGRAHREFAFIDVSFKPAGRADPKEFEGGEYDHDAGRSAAAEGRVADPNALFIRIPRPATCDDSSTKTSVPAKIPMASMPSEPEDPPSSASDPDEATTRRTFCPLECRDSIVNMMEHHFCAHPLLPGYSHPSREGIRVWAVKQMYNYCVQNDLPEVWAYLWENWYRTGRWELWARAEDDMIPRLKTTMMVESHWGRIKKDFLHHFHMPRLRV
ncbi:hypothetical protein B0H11DRAFT_2226000 [Mycena galericulata]|nr:hypothetical protein B0H11DRAFT_2226000 [Mycena galericulata]